VGLVLERLGLVGCQHVMVGGLAVKGLSGGERKRTSIGYELITEPNLMLLDEPTSGLDSSTALRIVKLLRREASRGMGVLCTIHQPSSQILMEFDRVILLNEGHTLYQGPVHKIQPYCQAMGARFSLFQNPADFLLKIA